VDVSDPSNHELTPNLLFSLNILHVPGSLSLPWEVNDVPHGVIHHHFYRSAVAQDDRDYYVYTPPNYDSAAKKSYPCFTSSMVTVSTREAGVRMATPT
jgi:enterochelin esterase family protein